MIFRVLDSIVGALASRRGIVPPGVRRADEAAERWPAFVPTENPLDVDSRADQRNQAAMRMMDEDVYGYVLLTVHKEAVGPRAAVHMALDVDPSWWPALMEVMERAHAELERRTP